MKKILFLLCFVSVVTTGFAQEDRYMHTMAQQLLSMDTTASASSWQTLANTFERIAAAEKTKWLPYYYAALSDCMSSLVDTVAKQKDAYLDKAVIALAQADSLEKQNSEIYTLKGFVAQARMTVDPMSRWMKYGPESTEALNTAKKLNPENPRPDFLLGQALLYTPEQFGGGKKVALPVLTHSMELFEKFTPKTPIDPSWGKKQIKTILEKLNK